MLERIRYRLLMRRLRREIALIVNEIEEPRTVEKIKSPFVTACNACGNIV